MTPLLRRATTEALGAPKYGPPASAMGGWLGRNVPPITAFENPAPSARKEVSTTSGRGLLVTTDSDEEYRHVLHSIRQVRLDTGTGEVAEEPGEPGVVTFPDAATREAAAAQLRGRLGAS